MTCDMRIPILVSEKCIKWTQEWNTTNLYNKQQKKHKQMDKRNEINKQTDSLYCWRRRAAPKFAGISAHPAFSAAITVGALCLYNCFNWGLGIIRINCSQLHYRCLLPTLQRPCEEWLRQRTAKRSSQQWNVQLVHSSGNISYVAR